MDHTRDIPVVYKNSVFRPEEPVNFPERSRLRITVHEQTATARAAAGSLKAALDSLRRKGLIRAGGKRPSRDELHERR